MYLYSLQAAVQLSTVCALSFSGPNLIARSDVSKNRPRGTGTTKSSPPPARCKTKLSIPKASSCIPWLSVESNLTLMADAEITLGGRRMLTAKVCSFHRGEKPLCPKLPSTGVIVHATSPVVPLSVYFLSLTSSWGLLNTSWPFTKTRSCSLSQLSIR